MLYEPIKSIIHVGLFANNGLSRIVTTLSLNEDLAVGKKSTTQIIFKRIPLDLFLIFMISYLVVIPIFYQFLKINREAEGTDFWNKKALRSDLNVGFLQKEVHFDCLVHHLSQSRINTVL